MHSILRTTCRRAAHLAVAATITATVLGATTGTAAASVPPPDRGQPVQPVCSVHWTRHGHIRTCRLVSAKSSKRAV